MSETSFAEDLFSPTPPGELCSPKHELSTVPSVVLALLIAVMGSACGSSSQPVDYTTFIPTSTATPTTFSQSFAPLADVTAGIALITGASYHGSTCTDDVVVRASP